MYQKRILDNQDKIKSGYSRSYYLLIFLLVQTDEKIRIVEGELGDGS